MDTALVDTHNIKRVILHIGRHKSGTSSIQQFFNLNLEHFSSKGILYPKSGRLEKSVGHHEFALSCFRGSDPLKHTSIVQAILSEVKPHHHTIIISSESFQTLDQPHRLQPFLNLFPNADREIVCYFREFVDYMQSSFRQATQNQDRFRTFDQFLSHRYPMRKFFKLWEKLGHFHIRWFHPDLLKDRDIVTDFCDMIDISGGELLKTSQNVSIGGNILFLKLTQSYTKANQLTYKNLSDLALAHPQFRRPFLISKVRTDKARRRNAYNRILEKKLGGVPLQSWTSNIKLPDSARLESDLVLVRDLLPDYDPASARGHLTLAKTWF